MKNIFNFKKKKTPSERSRIKKYRKIINKSLADLEGKDNPKNIATAEDAARISEKLASLRATMDLLEPLVHKQVFRSELVLLITTIVFLLGYTIFLIVLHDTLLTRGTHINLNYYSLVVGLIPVLLIAMYFSDHRAKYLQIDSLMTAISEFLGVILPAFVGLTVSLYAVASNSSNGLLFAITMYALSQLIANLSLKIVMPGLIAAYEKRQKKK